VVLHDRTGGSRDNIERSYSVANLPALENFQGEDLRGEWRLNVADLEGRDMGKLNRWALRIERLVTPSSTPFLREPEVLVSGVHSDFQLP
jgi:subtilisin-like proprotein convertase family protein